MTVVRTVPCPACKGEQRRHPGRLGQVKRDRDGHLWWFTGWPPRLGANRSGAQRIVQLTSSERSDYLPPDTLPARCRHHGEIGVSIAEVLRGKQ